MTRRARVLAVVAAVLAVAAPACSLSTTGAPTGDVTLYVTFPDAQDLVAGHTVQVSNVVVGSVRRVELDGYAARVTMSIINSRHIPVGTTATLRRTSLLGEHFVDLQYPDGFDPRGADFLEDEDEIAEATVQPDFEELASSAGEVVSAVAADDLAAVLEAGADALGGRGTALNKVIADLSQLATVLAQQGGDLAATVDGLGRLGATLAPSSDQVETLIDDVAAATATLGSNRDRIVTALAELTHLATATNDAILEPHAQRLHDMIVQSDAVVQRLAEQRDVLVRLNANLLRFVDRIDDAILNGQLLVYAWFDLTAALPGGAGAGAANTTSDPAQQLAALLDPAP